MELAEAQARVRLGGLLGQLLAAEDAVKDAVEKVECATLATASFTRGDQLSNSEELVIEEGQGPSPGFRRCPTITGWSCGGSSHGPPDRGHRNTAADTARQFVNADEQLPLDESATETPGLTALDVERAGSMADEGGASAAIVESADVERKAP